LSLYLSIEHYRVTAATKVSKIQCKHENFMLVIKQKNEKAVLVANITCDRSTSDSVIKKEFVM